MGGISRDLGTYVQDKREKPSVVNKKVVINC